MESEFNILSIDSKILENFKKEKVLLDEYKESLQSVIRSLSLPEISTRVKNSLEKTRDELLERIDDINGDTSLNFYIAETAEILEQFRKILSAPLKINFFGRTNVKNKDKEKICKQYLSIAEKYVTIEITKPISRKDRVVCKNEDCSNKKDFDVLEGNRYVCLVCSAEQVVMKNVSSYKDIDRVNISSKYSYDRKIHFRDAINQYQGKQNSTIPAKIYNDLERQFELHHLLIGTKETSKKQRFKNITKEHVFIFLKDLEHTSHYENIHLIHYNMTGKKPDDISYLEDKLLEDFDLLTSCYDKMFKHLDRKNFINTQYVLYQLLLKHKHPCRKEDFSILKTFDRKAFHDDIMKELFSELCWNFSSFL